MPRHLPYTYIPGLSPHVALAIGIVMDLLILLVFVSIIEAARAGVEKSFFSAMTAGIAIPPLRYALPVLAAPLWWTQAVCSVLIAVSGLALIAEINRESAESPASRPEGDGP